MLRIAPPPNPPPRCGRGDVPRLPLPLSGGGLGGGGTPSCSSTPMTSSLPTRCPAGRGALEHLTKRRCRRRRLCVRRYRHRPRQPPSRRHSCAACWCAICSSMADTCCPRRKRYARPAASSPALPTARTGTSGSASLCAAHSSRRRAAHRCCSSGSMPAARIIAWRPIRRPSRHAWTRSSQPGAACALWSARLAAFRRRTEAENDWIIGRELIRHGDSGEGRARLRRRSASPHPGAWPCSPSHMLALLPDVRDRSGHIGRAPPRSRAAAPGMDAVWTAHYRPGSARDRAGVAIVTWDGGADPLRRAHAGELRLQRPPVPAAGR